MGKHDMKGRRPSAPIRDGVSAERPLSERGAAADELSSPLSRTHRKRSESTRRLRVPRVVEDPYVGTLVDGRYMVERLVAQGGMGSVYLCRREVIGKAFAMKVLHPLLARRDDVTRRFLGEARAAAAIRNPHVVDIIDFGHMPDGPAYLVMEYLDGEPLTRLVRGRELSLGRALEVARQLTEGLGAAHRAGIVHRDLKPDNVLVLRLAGADFVKVFDFGVAKFAATGERITVDGCVFGTPHYMSPEQATGDAVDHRADIYALGVILYEMVTGRLPFQGDSPYRLMEKHVTLPPPPPSAHFTGNALLGAALDAVVLRCLAKNPGARFATMAELGEALVRLQREHCERCEVTTGYPLDAIESAPSHSPHASTKPDLPRARRRKRLPRSAVFGAALIAASAALSAGAWQLRTPSVERIDAASAVVAAHHAGSLTPSPVTSVDIVLSPLDAEVWEGERNLGRMPLRVPIAVGAPKHLEVRRPGYANQAVTVDGRFGRVEIELRPDATTAQRWCEGR
jgi:serine/threonine-protein kinase